MSERAALVDRCDRCGAFLRPMTPEQHRAVEAVYAELAEQLDWPIGSGIKLDAWEWHQLMIAAYAKYKRWKPVLRPALDGEGFVMTTRQKQSRLASRHGSELIEFARAWAIDKGVRLREPREHAA